MSVKERERRGVAVVREIAFKDRWVRRGPTFQRDWLFAMRMEETIGGRMPGRWPSVKIVMTQVCTASAHCTVN